MRVRLKEALQSGRLVKVAYLGQLCSPKMAEIIGLAGGFDAIWLDQEHASPTFEHVENTCRAAHGSGLDTFVRLAATDYGAVMRPLEAGAGGIMAAQVHTAQETEDIVRWAKFHPRGCRGVNGTGIDGAYGTLPIPDYLEQANANTFVAVQIENTDAVTHVERIAAVANLDLLFIGPADLSQSLGVPAQWDHPKMWNAIARVAKAAASNKVHWAILPPSAGAARRCVEMGCRMLSIGLDVLAVLRGWRSYHDEYADYFRK